METKPAKKESTGELVTLEQQVTKIAFSKGMGEIAGLAQGVPAKQMPGYVLAHTLLPLDRAKECIEIAYFLAQDGISDVQPWLERYKKLAKTELPKWAKKKSQEYLSQAYNALEGESKSGLISILYEFKGFIYGVFCRTLMERYGGES